MFTRNPLRHVALVAGAAMISLVALNANAGVVAGNYQDHKLPSTTRHTAHAQTSQASDRYSRIVNENARVHAGNYQDHVLPRSNRRNAAVEASGTQQSSTEHHVAFAGRR